MGKTKTDRELTDLLPKLNGIQEDIGAKPKSSEDEKKARAENVVTMGQGKKAQEKASKFLQLKGDIVDRLKSIHQMLKDIKEKEQAGFGGDNAKEIIKMQAEVRESLRQATDDWKELDEIYKKEARKKRSKFTPEELEVQAELVQRLYAEIEKVKEAQMKGYARGKGENTPGIPTKSLFMDSGKLQRMSKCLTLLACCGTALNATKLTFYFPVECTVEQAKREDPAGKERAEELP